MREWASAQAASGYLGCESETDTFELPPKQAIALTDEDSPVYMLGGYHLLSAAYKDRPKLAERLRSRDGFGWHEHDPERSSAPSSSSDRAPGGPRRGLDPGARGRRGQAALRRQGGRRRLLPRLSTALIARAYPHSTAHGFDYHDASIERARRIAAGEGVADNTQVAVASARDFPGEGYDLVCFFDCPARHGRPSGGLAPHSHALDDHGTVMLVEPYANDSLVENLNPVGRIYYAASTLISTPSSLDQEVGLGLGAQAGERRLRGVAEEAGFTRFRRATETRFNLVLEMRP